MTSIEPKNNLEEALSSLQLPKNISHKGQNGKLLVIGGSSIFHAASIWAAEAASKVVDMVHYSSTKENGELMTLLKSKFLNGIVTPKFDLLSYVEEDDCILIGPGMERGEVSAQTKEAEYSFEQICSLENEADYTYALIRFLIAQYPDKKFVFDAAALQMMRPEWLLTLTEKPIITPHCKEFEVLFDLSICELPLEEKEKVLQETAKKYNCVILFKQISDIVTDGISTTIINGGNPGLTKGGTGDVLSGITAAIYTKNYPITSCILASYLLKKSAEDIFEISGLLYNTSDLISQLPLTAKPLLFDN
jgi:NAD(P)H-hydrate epimerase